MQAVEQIGTPIHSMVQIVKGILARGENVRIFTGRVNPNRARINAIRARRAIEAWCKAALWAPPSSDLRRGHSSQPDAAVRQWRSYRNFAQNLMSMQVQERCFGAVIKDVSWHALRREEF